MQGRGLAARGEGRKDVDPVINYAYPAHAARLRRLTAMVTSIFSESLCALTTV